MSFASYELAKVLAGGLLHYQIKTFLDMLQLLDCILAAESLRARQESAKRNRGVEAHPVDIRFRASGTPSALHFPV
jgi:hypothetical protein